MAISAPPGTKAKKQQQAQPRARGKGDSALTKSTGFSIDDAFTRLGCALGSPWLPDPEGEWRCDGWLQKIRKERRNPFILAKGAKGRSVKLVHRVLRHWMCEVGRDLDLELKLPPRGDVYNEDSMAAVKIFQKWSHEHGLWEGLHRDGMVGHETLQVLDGYVDGPKSKDTADSPMRRSQMKIRAGAYPSK
ncbi:MAG: hypothetical protein HC927_09590 [Deltaproteobacteria bacterium]|nr:hypothetical protein [Deltaproteobacteria bacterium]